MIGSGRIEEIQMADTQGSEKVARAIVDAHNASDWAGAKNTLAPDSVYEEYGTQRRIEGSDAIVTVLQAWKTAFPDVKGTVNKALANGDTVNLEVTWRGTHSGPLETPNGSLPASGKSFTLVTAWSMDVQNGKIKNSRHYFDILTLLQQIGAAPA